MGILANLKTKAVMTVRRALSLTDPATWPFEHSSDAGVAVTNERVIGLSTAWACINLNCGMIGTLPLMVYRKNPDGTRSVASDHWLYSLIHDSPNSHQTALDFWEFMQLNLELRGNGYAYAPRAKDGRVISLLPVRADFVEVRELASGALEYRFPDAAGKSIARGEREVFHIRGFGGGKLGGISTMQFGRHVFGTSIALDQSAAGTFKNGIRPSGILKFASWLKPDQRKETKEILEREHAGAAHSGKPLILEGGVEFEKMSFTPEESQMLQSRQFSVEEVCRLFAVPPVLIGHTEKVSAWGSGIGQIIEGYVKFGLMRRLKRIEQAISKQLLTPEDRAAGIYAEFSIDGLLRGSPKERAEFYKSMVMIGVMTINECRRLENLPPVPGGDVPRLQMQNVPLSEEPNMDQVLQPVEN